MWSVDGLEVENFGRKPGGDQFTKLVDTIIRAQAHFLGISQASIRTNLKTSIGDGGVDTQVDQATATNTVDGKQVPGDPHGWLNEPTVWQYKASDLPSSSKIGAEINKPYADQCIKNGYAYRLCICTEIPPKAKAKAEKELAAYVRRVNPMAPVPRILSAGDIASWASSLPATVIHFFRPQLPFTALDLDAWRQGGFGRTPKFVNVPAWQTIEARLREHMDFMQNVPDVVFPIQGKAGVGKTRLVYEVASGIDGTGGILLYTNDDQHALQIATAITNRRDRAILVADECSLDVLVRLQKMLTGMSEHVRVIAIDNSAQSVSSGRPEILLQEMAPDIMERVLASNFAHVPPERRRAYAELSAGFVRFAAEMCYHDAAIGATGNIGPVADTLRRYLRQWFHKDEELEVVQALSLIDRIGFKEDVANELDLLCACLKIDRHDVISLANRLHNVPGFIALAGRYLYVTPEIIAQIAFEGAWQRWAEMDPDRFIGSFPPELLERFQNRVARSAPEEVRAAVGNFFRRWVAGLAPEHLASLPEVDRLISLIETRPETYLPVLRRLVTEASRDELLDVTGASTNGRWGARRQIVWLAERIAAFPEFFDDAEVILRRLAQAENENGIGNNATAVWRHFYRIMLSGTAVPFLDRLGRLAQLIHSSDPIEARLALDALDSIFKHPMSRILGPAVVAGRIPPGEWMPTSSEYHSCEESAVDLLAALAKSDDPFLCDQATAIVLTHALQFVARGWLEKLRGLFTGVSMADAMRSRLVTVLEDYFSLVVGRASSDNAPDSDYVSRVREWLESLKTSDLHGRLVIAAGAQPWHHRNKEHQSAWQEELGALAQTLVSDTQLLESELLWLHSPDARSAGVLGQELGMLDTGGSLLDRLIAVAQTSRSTVLARGYIVGLITQASEETLDRLNRILDDIETVDSGMAYDLFVVGGTKTLAFARTIKLVDAGRLPVQSLNAFLFGQDSEQLSSPDFIAVIERFNAVLERGSSPSAAGTALEFAAYRLQRVGNDTDVHSTDDAIVEPLWKLLTLTIGSADSTAAYWWAEILRTLGKEDPARAAHLAIVALSSDTYGLEHEVSQIALDLARSQSAAMVQALDEVIGDENRRWYLHFGNHKTLFAALDPDTVLNWLHAKGPAVARIVARHLPAPYISSAGEPVVPRLTELVLREFEEDDEVFMEFARGTHSMQLYSGDIAAAHEREGRTAEYFLNHPLRRVRDWAAIEAERAQSQAKAWRHRQEEHSIGL